MRDIRFGSDRGRVESLDGLRFFAILLVALYHYYSRWTTPVAPSNYYPYADLLAGVPVFAYGHYGVQLFFVISGFVISITLERCKSWQEFTVRRFARLWPSMVLCSLITFSVTSLFSSPFKVSALGFLPSLTFIDPAFFRILFGFDFVWIDGAYWSLFSEVRFYGLMAVLFFSFGRRFLPVLYGGSLLLFVLSFLADVWGFGLVRQFLKWVFFIDDLPWFLFGVSFFYAAKQSRVSIVLGMFSVSLFGALVRSLNMASYEALVMALLIPGLFWAALESSWAKRILSVPVIARAGLASYSLYLLHQNIGVTLISELASYFEAAKGAWLVPPVVFFSLSLFSIFIYKHWERPADKYFVRVLMDFLQRRKIVR